MAVNSGPRVLVTGGTGMIGANFIHRLVANGTPVTVLARPNSSLLRLESVKSHINIVHGDLADAACVQDAVNKAEPDFVYHLASTPFNPPTIPTTLHVQVNVHGMVNLLEAIRSRPKTTLVFTGSANVYGDGAGLREDHPLQPGNILGATKACATVLMQTYSRLYGIPTVELRLYTPFGPWERPGRLVPHTILSALRGQDIRMTCGTQERDYLYIDDVIDAMMQSIGEPVPHGAVYNICSGVGLPIRDVVTQILRLMGDPVKVHLGAVPTRPDEIWKFSGDNRAAVEALGWCPQTSLDDGLRRTIDWFTNHRELAEKLL